MFWFMSRLPVGSSATTTAGLLIKERAIALFVVLTGELVRSMVCPWGKSYLINKYSARSRAPLLAPYFHRNSTFSMPTNAESD
jgi:hypothetical protein